MNDLFRKIDQNRLIKTFIKLVRIDSPSYQEEKIIKYLMQRLKANGLWVKLQKVKNTGNIIAILKGNKNTAPLFFNAHFDTVEPGKGIKPIVSDKQISTDKTTILGADNKAALTLFLEGIEYIKRFNIPHPNIYFILTYAEEQGLIGAKNLDFSMLKGLKYGYSFDASGCPGTAVLSAPTHYQYTLTVLGKSAHAGVEPEKGISAIKAASALISRIRTGKLDQETTSNVGTISGGIATNIVPEKAVIDGEIRSRNEEKLKKYNKELARVIDQIKKEYKVKIKFNLFKAYRSYCFMKNDFLIKKFSKACKAINIKPVFEKSNGGSDCNIFNQNNLKCLNLGIGMMNVHTKKESILIKDLKNSLKLFLSIVINW